MGVKTGSTSNGVLINGISGIALAEEYIPAKPPFLVNIPWMAIAALKASIDGSDVNKIAAFLAVFKNSIIWEISL